MPRNWIWISIGAVSLLYVPVNRVNAQGCSDAGFCTAGAMSHDPEPRKEKNHAIGISLTTGSGDQSTMIYTPQLEWQYNSSRDLQLELKLPLNFADGDLGTNTGIGDPIVTVSKHWQGPAHIMYSATAGVRVSITDASAVDESNRPLPMPYQSGLGTTDLIVGVGFSYRSWLFLAAGYQQPLIHYNENGYLANSLPAAGAAYNAYFDSRQLRRSGDMLLRAEAGFKASRWRFAAGPLAIFHLKDDEIANEQGVTVSVNGSRGLTLNLTAKAVFTGKNSVWELAGGAPVVVRDSRPDGLTRHWVVTIRFHRILR